jgi:SAM-dependent methyltransferase
VLEEFRANHLPGVPAEALVGARVLEVGCGLGRLARLQLGDAPARYVGIDVSRFAVAAARGRLHGRPECEFYHTVDDREALLALPAEFDLAFAVSAFIHIPPERARAVLAFMAGKLAPGGRLSVDVLVNHPTGSSVERWTPGEGWTVFPEQGEALAAEMTRLGLVEVAVHRTLEKRAYAVGRRP